MRYGNWIVEGDDDVSEKTYKSESQEVGMYQIHFGAVGGESKKTINKVRSQMGMKEVVDDEKPQKGDRIF